jgi:serine/threonine protein kinase
MKVYFPNRDMKGENILVDTNGDIKLADFGMAKHVTSKLCRAYHNFIVGGLPFLCYTFNH